MAVVVPALTHAEPFGEHGLDVTLWTWIPAGDFVVDMGFHVDALTACLLIVVTTIGMLVHLYSVGYMAHDNGHLAVLRLPQPVHVLDAGAGPGGQLAAGVRGLGAGGPVVATA